VSSEVPECKLLQIGDQDPLDTSQRSCSMVPWYIIKVLQSTATSLCLLTVDNLATVDVTMCIITSAHSGYHKHVPDHGKDKSSGLTALHRMGLQLNWLHNFA
jgi:hypothetical protein